MLREKKKFIVPVVAVFAALLLVGIPRIGNAEDETPPMRTLHQLDLSEQQRERIEAQVEENMRNRDQLRQDNMRLRDQLRQEERNQVRNEVRIRDLQQQRMENRRQLQMERNRFHQEVEQVLTEEQRERWWELRQQRQEWRDERRTTRGDYGRGKGMGSGNGSGGGRR